MASPPSSQGLQLPTENVPPKNLGALSPSGNWTPETLGSFPRYSTGIESLDRLLLGGLPQGQISEIVGAASSGKTGLLLKILSQTTRRGERVALVDPFHTFDPPSAVQGGMILSRLLWVRGRGESAEERLGQALKALDILIRCETFFLIALDLEKLSAGSFDSSQRIPSNAWFRIKKTLQGKTISVLLVNSQTAAGSAASVVLELERRSVKWKVSGNRSHPDLPGHARLLRGLCSEVRLLRGKRHGRITLHCTV